MPVLNSNLPIVRVGNQKSAVFLRNSVGGHAVVAEIILGDSVARAFRAQIELFEAFPDYDEDPELFEHAAEAAVAMAAPSLVTAIKRVREWEGKQPTLFIIRGLQVCGKPVRTPADGKVDQASVATEVAILTGVMRHFGYVGTAYSTENNGRLLRAVCAVKQLDGIASSQGATLDLADHADNSHLFIPGTDDPHPNKMPPMNAMQWFVNITPEPAVPMRVKLIDDVIARFDPRDSDPHQLPQFRLLFEPLYRYAIPPSHGAGECSEPLPALVRLEPPQEGIAMRFQAGKTVGTTPQSKEAFELLANAVGRTPEEEIHLQRGDILGYPNFAATHRRTPFSPRYDGTDRFFIRIYGNRREDVAAWRKNLLGNGRVM